MLTTVTILGFNLLAFVILLFQRDLGIVSGPPTVGALKSTSVSNIVVPVVTATISVLIHLEKNNCEDKQDNSRSVGAWQLN